MHIFICVSIVISLIVSLFIKCENVLKREKIIITTCIGILIGMTISLITELFIVPFLPLETEDVIVETKQLKTLKDNEDTKVNYRRGIFVTRMNIDEGIKYVVMEGNNEQGYKMKEYDPMITYVHETKDGMPEVVTTYKDYKNKLARALLFRASGYKTHIYVPEGSICDEYNIDFE